MPISTSSNTRRLSKTEFDEIDGVVMKCAYASQNHFGKLCDEKIHETDLAMRLRAEGLKDVETQVAVDVGLRRFLKTYYLDLVVAGMVYELKAERSLSPAHQAQALNYAGLVNANRIKLINFGGERVEGKLLGTPFADLDRYELRFCSGGFRELTAKCQDLKQATNSIVREFGGFLAASLYGEAMINLLGGESRCVHLMPVLRDEIEMGRQKVYRHADDCAFQLTSLPTGALTSYQTHLESLIHSLPLKGLQWINIHQRDVRFKTIS